MITNVYNYTNVNIDIKAIEKHFTWNKTFRVLNSIVLHTVNRYSNHIKIDIISNYYGRHYTTVPLYATTEELIKRIEDFWYVIRNPKTL